MSTLKDITGQKFGRLTVIKRVPNQRVATTRWLCRCECGKIKEFDKNNLVNGHTASCGCYSREIITNNKYRESHGLSYTRIYHIWQSMKQRCYDKNVKEYKHYGLKNVSVCDEWMDFEVFYEWSKKSGYKHNLTIDRINCNGNYIPENCRWTTIKVQNRNKRNTVYLTKSGIKKSMGEWSELLNIPMSTMVNRRNKGLGDEDVLNNDYRRHKTIPDAELQSMKDEWGR